MRRRTPKYNGDIDEVLIMPIFVAVVLLVLGGLIFILCYSAQTKAEDVQSYNAEAEIFNALPKSDRETFQRFCKEDLLNDDLLIEPKEMPISAKQMFKIAFPWFLLILLIICTVATFSYYWYEKDSDYHLADLPLGSAYGWILLIMILPIGWPFLLGSRIFMWSESRPGNQAEAAEIERLAKEELTFEGNLQTTKFNERAKRVYTEFRTAHFRDSKLQAEQELRDQISSQKADLADYGKRIASLQRELGTTKAELKKLEAITPNREATRSEAQSEWQQIVDMRGVAKITASKRKAKPSQRFPRILIKVRVPYKNELSGVVISGVDSMASRQIIWECIQNNFLEIPFYIDGRSGGEEIQLFAFSPCDYDAREDYETWLFNDDEAAELECGARNIGYISAYLAGEIGHLITMFHRGIEIKEFPIMRNFANR